MRLFVVALQSMSYFSICHRYSLLCYLVLWSAICFAFARFILRFSLWHSATVYDAPALSSRYTAKLCVSKHFVVLSSATKRSIFYLCILAYFYLSQHATKPLFHCQRTMHISIHYTFLLTWYCTAWDGTFVLRLWRREHFEVFTHFGLNPSVLLKVYTHVALSTHYRHTMESADRYKSAFIQLSGA